MPEFTGEIFLQEIQTWSVPSSVGDDSAPLTPPSSLTAFISLSMAVSCANVRCRLSYSASLSRIWAWLERQHSLCCSDRKDEVQPAFSFRSRGSECPPSSPSPEVFTKCLDVVLREMVWLEILVVCGWLEWMILEAFSSLGIITLWFHDSMSSCCSALQSLQRT